MSSKYLVLLLAIVIIVDFQSSVGFQLSGIDGGLRPMCLKGKCVLRKRGKQGQHQQGLPVIKHIFLSNVKRRKASTLND